jgi:hypothetical protein
MRMLLQYLYLDLLFTSLTLSIILHKVGYDKLYIIWDIIKQKFLEGDLK